MSKIFSGNIYIFHAFDIGEDIALTTIEDEQIFARVPQTVPRYFKNYQTPLAIELPTPHATEYLSSKIHEFGVISLTYKIPFRQTLEDLRTNMEALGNKYQEQASSDAQVIFDKIQHLVKQPRFFHLRTSYTIIQLDYDANIDSKELSEKYGNTIAELVRFETETLADYQKQDLLDSAVGYYRGDFIIVDNEAAFVYDEGYEELLGLFEFSNIQHLELKYFDKLLAERLNQLYERRETIVPKRELIPLAGLTKTPVAELGRLKADISVITEQLQGSIKLANEPYINEIYELLVERLDIRGWKRSIDRKFDIIKEVSTVYYNRIETVRAEMLETLIIILILIELILGIFK